MSGQRCLCGHDWQRHGAEAGGCVECKCRSVAHEHHDNGGGYCDCGAQRCSLPTCDFDCKHGGWLSPAQLRAMRDEWTRRQLTAEFAPIVREMRHIWDSATTVRRDTYDTP